MVDAELCRTWGRNIYLRRKQKQLSQRQLGDKVGVKDATVSRWESGLLVPRDDHKISIAEALEMDVRMLFPLVRTHAAGASS